MERGGTLMLLPASLGPDGYHCFQSSSNDNSVHATGKDAYYLSEVESQSHCPLLSAFPTHGYMKKKKKKNTLFHSAFVVDNVSPSVGAGSC